MHLVQYAYQIICVEIEWHRRNFSYDKDPLEKVFYPILKRLCGVEWFSSEELSLESTNQNLRSYHEGRFSQHRYM